MLKKAIGCPYVLSISCLVTKGRDGQAGLKVMLQEAIGCPLLFISPLGTRGRDGQAGLKAVLKESKRCPLLFISPLSTKGRDGQAGLKAALKESKDVLYCPLVPYGQRERMDKQD